MTTPVKNPVNAAATLSTQPAAAATAVDTKAVLKVSVSVTAGTYASSTATLACGGQNVDFTASTPSASTGTVDISYTPKTALTFDATCQWNGSATVAGVDGGTSLTLPWSVAFSTVSWWPPKKILEIGVKGGDTPPQEVPMETNPVNTPAIGGEVWKQKVVDGTIQFVKTGMRLVGLDWATSDELYFAVFVSPLTKNRCLALVYAKTGLSVNPNPRTWGCKTEIFDAWWGTADGLIYHFPARGECYRVSFDQAAKTTTELLTACPAG